MGEYGLWPKAERFKPRLIADRLKSPFDEYKKPRRIFAGSMTDFFSDGVEKDWRDRAWNQMEQAGRHAFLVLTKRPERMAGYIAGRYCASDLPPNVWLGTSITNQPDANERIPWLLKTPAVVRWLSIEPLHAAIDLSSYIGARSPLGIHFVVVGAETGNRKGKIAPKPEWIESIRQQCEAAGAALFMKRSLAPIWGEQLIQEFPEQDLRKAMEA